MGFSVGLYFLCGTHEPKQTQKQQTQTNSNVFVCGYYYYKTLVESQGTYGHPAHLLRHSLLARPSQKTSTPSTPSTRCAMTVRRCPAATRSLRPTPSSPIFSRPQARWLCVPGPRGPRLELQSPLVLRRQACPRGSRRRHCRTCRKASARREEYNSDARRSERGRMKFAALHERDGLRTSRGFAAA